MTLRIPCRDKSWPLLKFINLYAGNTECDLKESKCYHPLHSSLEIMQPIHVSGVKENALLSYMNDLFFPGKDTTCSFTRIDTRDSLEGTNF
jgi:hypothetical protein